MAIKTSGQKPKELNVRKGNVVIPLTVFPIFSDGLILQYAQEVFILSFLKVMPPLSDKADTIESRCVAQIVVSPSQMAENLKVMTAHFKGFADIQEPDAKEYLLNKAGLK